MSRKAGLKFVVFRLISTEKSNNNFLNWSISLKMFDFIKQKLVLKAIFGTSLARKLI